MIGATKDYSPPFKTDAHENVICIAAAIIKNRTNGNPSHAGGTWRGCFTYIGPSGDQGSFCFLERRLFSRHTVDHQLASDKLSPLSARPTSARARPRSETARRILWCHGPGERDEKIQDRCKNRRHILLPLARLYADDRWHQPLRGILNRLQEQPLEVGRSTVLLA
jgi:hypothetical protein